MDINTSKDELRAIFRRNSRKERWNAAKMIYELSQNKRYHSIFSSHKAFADYVGLSQSMITHYNKAYEYYLRYENQIDQKYLSPEQVYNIHRIVGYDFPGFYEWLNKTDEINVLYGSPTPVIINHLYDRYIQSKNGSQG